MRNIRYVSLKVTALTIVALLISGVSLAHGETFLYKLTLQIN
jgi:hypothetical protein